MNPLTRLISGLFIVVAAVVSFLFFATLGLILVGILGVVLFVGALTLRGKGQETRVGNFRVITYGMPDPNAQSQTQQKPQQQKAVGDFVDLSPEDYREVSPDDKDRK